jgi:uncharacterized membrane protein
MLVERKHATATVAMEPDALFTWLCNVENWPRFFEDLEQVEQLGYHRYRFRIRVANHERTVEVAITSDPHVRRITWKHLTGPVFDGTFWVSPVGETRSKVELALHLAPQGFLEGVIDAIGREGAMGWLAGRQLQRLQEQVKKGAIRAPRMAGERPA